MHFYSTNFDEIGPHINGLLSHLYHRTNSNHFMAQTTTCIIIGFYNKQPTFCSIFEQ
jgi:hypothetical protein